MSAVRKLGAIVLMVTALMFAGSTKASVSSTTTWTLAANAPNAPNAGDAVETGSRRVSSLVVPRAPGPLTIGPNGNLYVADETLDEILERLPNGHFKVVAGTGRAGFSGDGGQAPRAEINQPEGMAFAKDGTLYFADSANNRVRAVRPDGVIVTVAGDGRDPPNPPHSGTLALRAGLDVPTAVAISPSGDLYVALEGSNAVVEITSSTIVVAAADFGGLDPQYPGSDCMPSGLAFDLSGDLYVNCLQFNDVIMRRPNGPFVYRGILRPHDVAAGLSPGPGDSVLGVYQSELIRFTRTDRSIVHSFYMIRRTVPFWPTGVAVGREDTIYLDQEGGAGVGPPAIVALSSKATVTVLWLSGNGNKA